MRGAIFDVDGTLLDSMQVWWDVVVDFSKNTVLNCLTRRQKGIQRNDYERIYPNNKKQT